MPKATFFHGEPIEVAFKATNRGEKAVTFPTNNAYDGFSFTAADKAGKPIRDNHTDAVGSILGCDATIKPGETYSEPLPLNRWFDFEKPGTYTVNCRATLYVTVEGREATRLPINELMPAVTFETKLSVIIVRDDKALAEHMAKLEEVLKSPEWYAALPQMRTVAFSKCEPAFKVIDRIARADGPAQSGALYWLTAYGLDRALPALKNAADSRRVELRIAAMEIMAEADARGAEAVVNSALQSKDAVERRAAIELCRDHKYPECLPALLKMSHDDDITVRRSLSVALEYYGDARAVPALLNLLKDQGPDPMVRICAADGLDKLGRKNGIPVMIEMLQFKETEMYHGTIAAKLEEFTGIKMKYHGDYDSWHAWWENEGRAKYEKIAK